MEGRSCGAKAARDSARRFRAARELKRRQIQGSAGFFKERRIRGEIQAAAWIQPLDSRARFKRHEKLPFRLAAVYRFRPRGTVFKNLGVFVFGIFCLISPTLFSLLNYQNLVALLDIAAIAARHAVFANSHLALPHRVLPFGLEDFAIPVGFAHEGAVVVA